VSGWHLSWYEVRMIVGSGEACLPLEELEAALRKAVLPETRRIRVEPANGSEALVVIVTRARHGGAAAARLADAMAECAPQGWNWASAAIAAERRQDGIRRWPRLAVDANGEMACAEAALAVAEWALGQADPEAEALRMLRALGLTRSAGDASLNTGFIDKLSL
jgi:hypothetical protein